MKTINRSERSAMLYTQINGRIFTQEEREGTYTPFDKECKTPFLDAFEKHSDTEPYVVCLAHAIVDSQRKDVSHEIQPCQKLRKGIFR